MNTVTRTVLYPCTCRCRCRGSGPETCGDDQELQHPPDRGERPALCIECRTVRHRGPLRQRLAERAALSAALGVAYP